MAWCHSNVGPRSFLGGLAFLLAAGALSHAAPLPKGELKGKPMPTPVAVPLPPVAPDVPAAPLPVPMPIVAVPAPIAIQVEVEEPAKGPDLQKKIDDALKELDKLDKADPNAPISSASSSTTCVGRCVCSCFAAWRNRRESGGSADLAVAE